jgi:hypothetical protein
MIEINQSQSKVKNLIKIQKEKIMTGSASFQVKSFENKISNRNSGINQITEDIKDMSTTNAQKGQIKEITTQKESSDCKSIEDENNQGKGKATPRKQNEIKTLSSFNKHIIENADKSTFVNSSRMVVTQPKNKMMNTFD